jgi:hypothetical protein
MTSQEQLPPDLPEAPYSPVDLRRRAGLCDTVRAVEPGA